MIITDRFPTLLLALVFSCLFLSPVLSENTADNTEIKPNSRFLTSPETGVDYTPLQKRLQRQQWQEANETSTYLILRAVSRDEEGWMSDEDVAQLACWDLKTLDRLWKEYSQGKFGFSVQFPIFINTGNQPGKLIAGDFYDDFGARVGWRKDGQWIAFKYNLIYNLDAPIGHLPNPRSEYQVTGGRLNYTALTKRMVECRLVFSTFSGKHTYDTDLTHFYSSLEKLNKT
ncbi:GUN4 domain-containing protein [Cyanobacterium sp. uoEpiScrs1]|uniref:GUN4 domain-containing protein n=1 Tax=Cyanobacterium sp. uoEpiScrs1 TaxID=2976343 RepID=UPI00226A2232|nr:GUN4 domain-containing protein [Cyanobacterium sp. uoEpiScrs1]